MSALHPLLKAALEAADPVTFNKWSHEPDRYCVSYGLTEDADRPLAVEVTLFNINGTNCCFRLAIALGDVLQVWPWSEPKTVVPFHRRSAETHASTNNWIEDDEEDLL